MYLPFEIAMFENGKIGKPRKSGQKRYADQFIYGLTITNEGGDQHIFYDGGDGDKLPNELFIKIIDKAIRKMKK